MEFVASDEVRRIKSRLDHPIIDSDGHAIEYLPVVRDILREQAGEDAAAALDRTTGGAAAMRGLPAEQMRGAGMIRISWWGLPARNTLDRATALLPALLAARIEEMGIDHAILYPTYGLGSAQQEDADLRRAIVRAFNTFYSESFRDHAASAHAGRHHPDAHRRRGDRRARVRDLAARAQGVHVRRPDRPTGAGARRADPGRPVARHARRRQRLRLRPGVGQVRGARRVTHVPHRLDGVADAQLAEQLRLQPHRHVRDRGRDAGAVIVPRRRAPSLPDAPLRVPGGRCGLGGVAVRGADRPLGEAQPRRHRSLRPVHARPRAPRPTSSSGTGARRTAIASTGSTTGSSH